LILVSFVVDRLSLHYYQAELLLHSLKKNAGIAKDNIIVQCLSRVDNIFLDFLNQNGYKYHIIEPYLDGKYCNKLQQLEYFADRDDIEGVVLMDTDMFVLNPLKVLQGDCVIAKVVDLPNPKIETLKTIYNEAKLTIPKEIGTDCKADNDTTLDNNFNGGFYYIPQRYINIMAQEWKKWGAWLYNKPQLFDDPQKFIHVDQISFSLALIANRIEYKHLSTNYNFPIHFNGEFNFYNQENQIAILHYHREIDQFGLLNSNKVKASNIEKYIQIANNSIVQKGKSAFFGIYKQSLKPRLEFDNSVIEYEKKIQRLATKKLKLIIHAGTPKTGTTSLQFFMDENNEKLKEKGYFYPKEYIGTFVPKHQWIASCLKAKDYNTFFSYIERIYNKAIDDNMHTVFLSTEGVYNHWWDYDAQSKAILQVMAKYFDLRIWVIFRDSYSFLKSFYKQNLKNPAMDLVRCYGKDLAFSQMLKDKWFENHLDYLGFIYDCESIFGENNIKVFQYSNEILKIIIDELKLDINVESSKRENIGQSSIAVELLRVINRYNLNGSDKQEVVKQLSNIDEILKKYDNTVCEIDNDAKKTIQDKFKLQSSILREKYGLDF